MHQGHCPGADQYFSSYIGFILVSAIFFFWYTHVDFYVSTHFQPVDFYGRADLAHSPQFFWGWSVRSVIQNKLVAGRIIRVTATDMKIRAKAP